MGEEYSGIKFTCKISGKISAPDSIIKEYLQIDSSLKKFLSPLKNEGNMSMRTMQGFMIKGAGEKMTKLGESSLSHVTGVDEAAFTITAEGKTPSSESFLHYLIYKENQEINFILHFHDDALLEALQKRDFCRISPLPYGSMELARAASKPKENIILLENHGFILKAGSAEELLKRVGELYSLR